MNAVQLGFPKAVAEAHGSRPKTYASSYAMVQSIEKKLRGSGPDIDYHAEKQKDMMNQMMNKFKDAKQIQTHQSQYGTSVRTIPYDGLKMNMPLNMVTVCDDKPFSGSMYGSSLRYENQKLGKDLLDKRAKQLGQQQMAMESSVVPTTAQMDQRMTGPTESEISRAIADPSELAMEEIVSNYEFLLDGLEQGLVGAGSFDYVRRIASLIKKHAPILSSSDFTTLKTEYNDDALQYARDIITSKVSNTYRDYDDYIEKFKPSAGRPAPLSVDTYMNQRRATEATLETALVRLGDLLSKLTDLAFTTIGPEGQIIKSSFASEKERKLAIASTLRDAGLEAMKEPKAKREMAMAKRKERIAEDVRLAREQDEMMMAQPNIQFPEDE
jgi:hypothetical protein